MKHENVISSPQREVVSSARTEAAPSDQTPSGRRTIPSTVAGQGDGPRSHTAEVGQADGIQYLGQSAAGLEIGSLPPLRLFYSYAHKDEELRKQFEVQLKLLERWGVISSWHDRLIGAGHEWKDQISKNLERADIIVLLVSANFIASDYCYDIEMTRALERHEAGEARVIPVIVRDVDWSDAPFRKLQALPRNGRAVRQWPDRDSAWRNVVEGIKAAAADVRRTRR